VLASRLPFSARPPACSRCFRTDAQGRIPLRADWPALFSALSPLGEIAVQSRHTYARLVHLGPPPGIVWDEDALTGRDESGSLRLHAALWGRPYGRLAICSCCDAPGHIEIHNVHGGDILQLCPTAEVSPAAWAACLDPLVEPAAAGFPADRRTGFPLLPPGLHPLREEVGELSPLLAALGARRVPVRFLLRTPEIVHLREFTPRRVVTDYPLLVATDFRTTLQLALPPVQSLAVGPDLGLHLAGPGGTLLLSLIGGACHAAAWRAALHAAFPSLRPLLSTP